MKPIGPDGVNRSGEKRDLAASERAGPVEMQSMHPWGASLTVQAEHVNSIGNTGGKACIQRLRHLRFQTRACEVDASSVP